MPGIGATGAVQLRLGPMPVAVGDALGAVVGVGVFVGEADGPAVGVPDPDALGAVVGVEEAPPDGVAVGDLVGVTPPGATGETGGPFELEQPTISATVEKSAKKRERTFDGKKKVSKSKGDLLGIARMILSPDVSSRLMQRGYRD